MIEKSISFKEEGFLKTNIKYGIIGIVIGLTLSVIYGNLRAEGIETKKMLFNILFSFFITLSIANVVALTQRYFSPSKVGFWKFVAIYYLCSLAGLFIGIELSYLIISLIFNINFEFGTHVGDYKSTSLICIILSTLILFYHLQRVNATNALNAKELDLIKLNQLKTQAELQALQAKINPHFLYNTLNSIASLIHEDANKAEDMTLKLSQLFRYSMNTLTENFSSIEEELTILNAYLDIEKVRFGERINFEIVVPENLLNKKVPRFLLQPLVENALKHGLQNKAKNGLLKVEIEEIANCYQILIFDNGIPFPEDLIAGYGLQSTFDKLKLLYKEDYEIKLINTPHKHIKISIPTS